MGKRHYLQKKWCWKNWIVTCIRMKLEGRVKMVVWEDTELASPHN